MNVWQTVLVADIEADGLIGVDLFRSHDCELHYKDQILNIDNISVALLRLQLWWYLPRLVVATFLENRLIQSI